MSLDLLSLAEAVLAAVCRCMKSPSCCPLMPVMLLGPDLPVTSRWLPAVAAFSMYPLLKKDGLALAYAALLMLWVALAWPGERMAGAQVLEAEKKKIPVGVHLAWDGLLGLLLKASGGLAAGHACCVMPHAGT